MREMTHECIDPETERHLCCKDDPMPTMQAQIEGVDLTESKKEHEDNEPRKNRLKRQEISMAEGTYDHRDPKSVTIKKVFDIYHFVIYHFVIYLVI